MSKLNDVLEALRAERRIAGILRREPAISTGLLYHVIELLEACDDASPSGAAALPPPTELDE